MLKCLLALALGLLLAGCGSLAGPPPPGTAPPAASPADPSRSPVPLTPVAYPSEPPEVVRAFLATLQDDLTGGSSVGFLTSDLRRAVDQGRPLPVILGVPDIYESFKVGAAEPAADASVHVKAVLEFRHAVERDFALVREAGEWHIADIIPVDAGTYPPEQAVIDFLASLQADPSGAASLPYLSAAARAGLGGQTPLDWLDLPAPLVSFEVARPEAASEPVEIEATLRLGDGHARRVFGLVREGEGWMIDSVR